MSSRATRGWEKFYTAFARKWRRGCQAYPRGGCRGNFRALCTCVNVTKPTRKKAHVFNGVLRASLASLGIPMAGPFAPNLRTSFAIPKRLLSVTWRTEGEVTLQSNQALLCKCQAYTCAFAIGPEPVDHERGDRHSEAPGVCHGNAMVYHSELWDFIGVAMKGLSYAVANCLAKCLRTLGLEPCRCCGNS